MKRVFEILDFCTNALGAITKGCKVALDHWPAGNPFKRSDSSDSIQKQSSESNQSDVSTS